MEKVGIRQEGRLGSLLNHKARTESTNPFFCREDGWFTLLLWTFLTHSLSQFVLNEEKDPFK